jgi:hypothetical protein
MNNMDTCLPSEYYNILWRTSWFGIISFIFALYKEFYDFAFLGILVFLTSINYWKYPINNWRRKVDMFTVQFGITYQIIKAYYVKDNYYYYSILSFALSFYIFSLYFSKKNKLWLSTVSHSLLHFFGNISNVVLYILID